jgi:hypothetical protein
MLLIAGVSVVAYVNAVLCKTVAGILAVAGVL